MGIITEFLGTKSYGKKEVTLASTGDVGVPVSSKVTPKDERIDPSELERAYKRDPITFNSINKSTQMIMAAGYTFEFKTEKAKAFYTEFFENIGVVGEEITLDDLFYAIYKDQKIFGSAFVELVYDARTDKRVVDLLLIDPKRMDYAKDSEDNIVLDRYGRPVGYCYKLPWDSSARSDGDSIPQEYKGVVTLKDNSIFMLPKRVCHFKLYISGDGLYGIGEIEPSYKSIVRRMNVEEAQSNSIYARGTYPVIAYVGDEEHEATPQNIDKTLEELTKMNHKRYHAFPNWIRVEPLEVKQSEIVQQTLEYLRVNSVASSGMPMAFATGAGEATNRATLSNQQRLLEFTLNDHIRRTIATFTKNILRRIAISNKIDEVPKITWGTIGLEGLNDKADRITRYVKNGILSSEDVKDFILKSEGMRDGN